MTRGDDAVGAFDAPEHPGSFNRYTSSQICEEELPADTNGYAAHILLYCRFTLVDDSYIFGITIVTLPWSTTFASLG